MKYFVAFISRVFYLNQDHKRSSKINRMNRNFSFTEDQNPSH